jgi:hypothetical protein
MSSPSFLDRLIDWWKPIVGNGPAGSVIGYGMLAVVAIIVMWIAWRLFRRRRRTPPLVRPDLAISIVELGEAGPPAGLPTLELYNLPMRLAAVVLAPVGRVGDLPPEEELAAVLEAIIPGLDKIAAAHQPVIRRWPSQVSARGFAHLFFANAKLPGEGGKGTPWASVAGLFKLEGQPLMAGLVFCAATPNSLGQTIIEREHDWLGCLRVRWS